MISSDLLLRAYASGIFPMGGKSDEIVWFSPDMRGVIPLDTFHVPHGLRRTLKRQESDIKINTAFSQVLAACADRWETWITPTIHESYVALHEAGYAHSVEVFQEGELVGGLYGVALGAAFFGESMFHRVTDASKVALYHLVKQLHAREFQLLDTQWVTPHLAQFGAIEIPREEYLVRLSRALGETRSFL